VAGRWWERAWERKNRTGFKDPAKNNFWSFIGLLVVGTNLYRFRTSDKAHPRHLHQYARESIENLEQ